MRRKAGRPGWRDYEDIVMNAFGSPTSVRVTCEIRDHVADVRLARSEKLNALDLDMFERIVEVGESLIADADVRAVVLSGEGKAFCAGIDIECLTLLSDQEGHARLLNRSHEQSNLFQRAALIWRDLGVPVIAALHGSVLGGGLQIALAADIRIAEAETRFSIMESRWGIIPDMGLTVLMNGLTRADVVRELTYTGRVFDASEALDLGLLTRVSENPHAAALALAHEIAGRSPDAIRAAKRLFNAMDPLDGAALTRESVEQILLFGGEDHKEAVRANLERRSPTFRDR
jgi:enoyl-CoA hydratase/carnithine racemase